MADQDEVGGCSQGIRHDILDRHRPELGIEETDVMAGVDQRATQRERSQRRQMVVGDTAADGGVRRIDEDDFYAGP